VIALEEWAEVRRLHRAEGVSIKEIARRLGLARNTVRAALRADAPPSRERGLRGSLVCRASDFVAGPVACGPDL